MNDLIDWFNAPLSSDVKFIFDVIVIGVVLFLIWVDPLNRFGGKK